MQEGGNAVDGDPVPLGRQDASHEAPLVVEDPDRAVAGREGGISRQRGRSCRNRSEAKKERQGDEIAEFFEKGTRVAEQVGLLLEIIVVSRHSATSRTMGSSHTLSFEVLRREGAVAWGKSKFPSMLVMLRYFALQWLADTPVQPFGQRVIRSLDLSLS